jgi:hypothetical protein
MKLFIPNDKAGQQGMRGLVVKLLAVVLLSSGALTYTGCAGEGVAYDSYYGPSYAGYYSDYGYNGDPYWGGGPYVGGEYVIGGSRHRGYYGGHHFAHDFRGGGVRGNGVGIHGGGAHIGGGGAAAHGGGRR